MNLGKGLVKNRKNGKEMRESEGLAYSQYIKHVWNSQRINLTKIIKGGLWH